MKVVLFGATGMVGQGVLRECLLDPKVTAVLAVGRAGVGQKHDKLSELVLSDLHDYSAVGSRLAGYDACFFCLGVSAAGLDEAAYTRITYDLTLAAAKALLAASPGLTFIYVSGAGTDSSEKGRAMWARVKGRTENELMKLPFKGAYMFRPGAIQPLHGIKSRTTMYRVLYAVMWPFMPLMRAMGVAVTTEEVGKAMIAVADKGYEKRVLEVKDLKKVVVG
jgi:uncharacterized protein YbjT (DUF2867 family)